MDIYAEITNRMIKEMEAGVIPWRKPWMASGAAVSHTTGKPYSLLNQMLLGRPGEWLTFKQVNAEGGYVRKGEKASMVVFWKWLDQEDEETHEVKQVPLKKSSFLCLVAVVSISFFISNMMDRISVPSPVDSRNMKSPLLPVRASLSLSK